MTRPAAADVDVALRLLLLESAGPDAGPDAAALRVYVRLAARLEPLIGVAGMRALMTRSAKLTVSDHPCFASLVVDWPGSTKTTEERLRVCFGDVQPEALSSAAAALYGTLLGLLASFIGEQLVWQVVRGAFPEIEQNVKETEQ